MPRPIRLNIISESEFAAKGHGVHTAYLEMVHALRDIPGIEVTVNADAPADIVHLHTFGPYALKQLLQKTGKKVITAHIVPDSWIGSLKFAKVWAPLGAKYLKFYYNRADMILAVSGEVERHLRAIGVHKPISVMHNTIDTGRYAGSGVKKAEFRRKLGIPADNLVVLGAGQIQPRKRFDVFPDLAENMPDVTFIWAGGVPFKHLGDDYEHILKLIKHKPDNLIVTGIVDFEEIANYYAAADVFLLPSVQETFGLVVVEAAASGLPVIVRDITDYDSTFADDVLRGDDTTFAQVIQKLRTDKAFYEQACRKSARLAKRFDSKASAKQLLALYKNLLHG